MKYLLLLLIIIHLFFLTNLSFTAWPEMLSFPYLRNNGYLLYKDMVHVYPPLLTMMLSELYRLFGYNLAVLQAATWIMLLFNDILIFLIIQKLSKKTTAALFGVGVYVFLQPFLEGNQMWFDLAITTPLLLGFLATVYKRFLLGGVLFSTAAFGKQTGGLFFIGYTIWLFSQRLPKLTLLKVLLTPLIFIIPLGIRLLHEEALQGFLNWVIIYPSKYWTNFPGYIDMSLSRQELSILLLITLPAVIFLIRQKMWLLLLFSLIGIISVYPRFSFFHFQTALPFFAIVYGLLSTHLNSKKIIILSSFASAILFFNLYKPSLTFEWRQPNRFWSVEEDKIAQKLSGKKDIYLLGYHSGIYVLANSLPPKPWIDNYPWVFEVPGVEVQTLKAWKKNPPTYILWQQPQSGNWYDIGTYQPKAITQWIRVNYEYQGQDLWKIKN